MRPPVEEAVASKRIDDRGAREGMAGDAERVVTLLVDRDKEDIAAARSGRRWRQWRRRAGLGRQRAPREERAAREAPDRVRDGREVHIVMLRHPGFETGSFQGIVPPAGEKFE
jgi:hypothetical protein